MTAVAFAFWAFFTESDASAGSPSSSMGTSFTRIPSTPPLALTFEAAKRTPRNMSLPKEASSPVKGATTAVINSLLWPDACAGATAASGAPTASEVMVKPTNKRRNIESLLFRVNSCGECTSNDLASGSRVALQSRSLVPWHQAPPRLSVERS